VPVAAYRASANRPDKGLMGALLAGPAGQHQQLVTSWKPTMKDSQGKSSALRMCQLAQPF